MPTALNGQPAALAYVVRMDDGRWVAVCMTVMTLDEDGRLGEAQELPLRDLAVLDSFWKACNHQSFVTAPCLHTQAYIIVCEALMRRHRWRKDEVLP